MITGTITLRVEGLEAIANQLGAFDARTARNILRRSTAAGARIIRDKIKETAPVATSPHKRAWGVIPPGTIKRSPVSVWARELSVQDDQVYIVTLRRGKKHQRASKANKDAYYWPWVEYGHKIVPRKAKNSANQTWKARRTSATRMVEPRPFFIPAVNASSEAASAAIVDRLKQEIVKAMT
jgi:hypothetical protein